MIFYGSLILWAITVAFGPYDITQGISSKLLYVHVPTVWIAYLGYSLTFVYSLLYLFKKEPKYLDNNFAFSKPICLIPKA